MNQRSTIGVSVKKYQVFLIIFIFAILCICQTVSAQSGRRQKPVPTPVKTPITKLPAKNESKVEAADTKSDEEIRSIIVLGNSRDTSSAYSRSNHLSIAIKECIRILNKHIEATDSKIEITKGKKMPFQEAIEKAKEETETHILWLELVTSGSGYGSSYVSHIDYALLSPKTAKRLITGRAKQPTNTTIVGPGGVISPPRVSSRRPTTSSQIRSIAREVAYKLIRWEWI